MKRERLTPSKSGPRYAISAPNKPHWLQKCELGFLKTGRLNLSSVSIPDLSLVKSRSTLKELNISRCKLESLEGLAYQPNIAVLNADHSHISSFKNFASVSHATIYSLKNTPLAQDPNYLIGLLLMAEDDKIIVNGKHLSSMWYRKADTYPSFTRDLLNNGWSLEYPCPKSEILREICREFNVTYIEDDDPASDTEQFGDNQNEEEEESGNFLDKIDRLMNKHNEMISQASRDFELLDMSDVRFAEEIINMLETQKHYVFQNDGDLELQVVTAVRALCMHRAQTRESKQASS
ncbi:hypothetical protein TRFO_13467 [Tritrichomonas foetus]|uniref:Leucine Rich Repeat family protein n=1 Tax=Tritrichomonas foetus TaxID=1144522 RepID=A0A1J4KY11_9EUKA|nr:hypothetical protein TRFO_13467 [Tritrichomonas foetus]|eukprot:OHT16137.1 hypothetical protein TRFO_13467 [Tritrichomonas foetus]